MPGVCRLGDRAKNPVDVHGCPACPHSAIGPAISASSNVWVNGMPALRQQDIGMHMACCGTNTWKIIAASGAVFINGSAMVRQGDPTQHCGGLGKMVDASGNVVDGSPLTTPGPFGGIPPLPPLPLNQVQVFPDEEPGCLPDGAFPGLPTSGPPQVYDQAAAERAIAESRPHASEGPSTGEQIASEKRKAFDAWLAGNEKAQDEANGNIDRLQNESKLADAVEALKGLVDIGKGVGGNRKKIEQKEREIRELEQNINDSEAGGVGGPDRDREIREGEAEGFE